MSDIFISYARNDHQIAKKLASALEERRWSVWWDRKLAPGVLFDLFIRDQLAKARCIIVLWSRQSVTSEWVKKEALFGLRRKKLIPVLLEDVIIPKRLRRIHAANFIGWKGSRRSERYKEFISRLESLLGEPGTITFVPLESITSFRTHGKPFSGFHLKNCLNKAPSDRRSRFMDRHCIIETESGNFIIRVRQFHDGSTILERSGRRNYSIMAESDW